MNPVTRDQAHPAVWRNSIVPVLLLLYLAIMPDRTGADTANELYRENCSSCHGRTFNNPKTQEWLRLSQQQPSVFDERFTRIIAEGDAELGMPAFAKTLDDKEILALVVLLREHISDQAPNGASTANVHGNFVSQEHSFRLETIATAPGVFWSMSFLPDDSILITEKSGTLYRYRAGAKNLETIKNIPSVWNRGQGGLLDVLVHPNYENNRWIYLAFSDRDSKMTAIVRGKIKKGLWTGQQNIFFSDDEFAIASAFHFGTRMVINEGYLYFGIGDRGIPNQSQDLSRPNGKIHRIHDDGRVPNDNPFVDKDDHFATIWTYGNRNPQGLTAHPDGGIWEAEHGPRGGDEINLIIAGRNYGWPIVSHGINYDGTPLSKATEREGIDNPLWHWTPSIAVSNIDFYVGQAFAAWNNNLLAASLALQELHRLLISDDAIISSEIILKDQGRIRDVRSGPDGLIYLLIERRGRSRLMRMRPVPTHSDPARAVPRAEQSHADE